MATFYARCAIVFNWYVHFSFRDNCITFGWDNQIPYLTLKFKFKVMVKVKPNGRIWCLNFFCYICILFSSNRNILWLRYKKIQYLTLKIQGQGWYVCFLFRVNLAIFGWGMANSIFSLKIVGQGHTIYPYLCLKILGQCHNINRAKSNQVIYMPGPSIPSNIKIIRKVLQKLSREQISAAGCAKPVAAYEPVQTHKVTTGIPAIMHYLNWYPQGMLSEATLHQATIR